MVPTDIIEETLEQVPRSVAALSPLVDYTCELNNAPKGDDIELLTEGETWESFTSHWLQTCAYVPGNRKQSRRKEISAPGRHDE